METQDFKQKTIAGLKWNTLNRVVSQVFVLVIGIVLARLLSPQEFGIIGMVTVLTGFADVFIDFGFTSAIIQNRNSDQRHWSSVFWINLGISFLLALAFTLCAPLIADFYNEPVLEMLTMVVAWTFFFQAFNLVQQSLLKKELRFKELTIIGLAAQLIAGIIAIVAASNEYSYWSLVIRQYIIIVVTMLGVWVVSKWLPKFIFDKSAVKELASFTLPLMGTQSLNYWTRNADYLMIGKVLGDTALGIYTQAYKLMLAPLQNVSQVISGVMFPAYSLIQDDKAKIKRTYLQITRTIAFITFPAMLGLCAVAEPFILVLLGEKWTGVIPILQILAPLGASQSIATLNGNIFLSQGATNLQLKVGGIAKLVMIAAMVVGLYLYALIGIAAFYAVSSVLMSLVLYHFMGGLIDLSVGEILRNLSKLFFAALLMGIAVFTFDFFFLSDWMPLARLSILVGLGGILYGCLVLLFKIEEHKVLFKYLVRT